MLSLVCVSALSAALLPSSAASARAAQDVTVGVEKPVYLVDEGGNATVGITVTTSDGAPLAAATAVDYEAAPGTAAAVDFAAASGTVTFAAGTPSGGRRSFEIASFRDRSPEVAEALGVRVSAGASAASASVVINANGLPYQDRRLSTERRVADLLSRMTLVEKIGQMTQAERAAVFDDPTRIAQWHLGSVLSGGGSTPPTNTPEAWVAMVNDFQAQALSTRLQIPMIYGIDAVHGHGNVYGATIFPHNVGLGSSRDADLAERIGHATATEVRATGIPWNFSPCVCVSRDERWGRAYESFGEDPALVIRMSSIIEGLQGSRLSQRDDVDRVLATPKHYAGDGDTRYDQAVADANVGKPWYEQRYPIDQGITVTNRRDFERIDLAPYEVALRRHDAGSVMPSFSSVDWTEDGVGNPIKMHANRSLITDRLKKGMHFDGFVVSDWEGIHQIPDPALPAGDTTLTALKVRVGVNAGTDMFMEPNTSPLFQELLLAEVQAGRVSTARIDDAVRRILRTKFELGLFEQPYAPTAGSTSSAVTRTARSPARRSRSRRCC
jgi:beta-glucosidase